MRLFKQGELDAEIYAIICSNIRVADQRIGDVKAQAAALEVGEARLNALMDRYGDAVVADAIAELRRRAAQQMRAFIGDIPERRYEATAWVDSPACSVRSRATLTRISSSPDSSEVSTSRIIGSEAMAPET